MADFNYIVEKFDDIQILRYQVPGFESLSLSQKLYIYYLSEAAIAGRDVLWDQHYKHNLAIRHLLEAIYVGYTGDKKSQNFLSLEGYLKKCWLANGIHHHFSMDKFVPGFSELFLREEIERLAIIPNNLEELIKVIFDSERDKKRVSLDGVNDLILSSANNFYEGVTQVEVEYFYAIKKNERDQKHPSRGLNSKLIKIDGVIYEKIWKLDGMYHEEIQNIISYLRQAREYAENETQQSLIDLLVTYYETGDLKVFDDYSIAWLQETQGRIDFVNGFIEVYGDSLGIKGTWESLVNFKDIEASKRTEIISSNAQWFEDHSPVDSKFKRDKVTGVSAKVITAAMLGGSCYPSTPIGINLPNAEWIRTQYGSKSVTIDNITSAYDEASKLNGSINEFVATQEDIAIQKTFGHITSSLHTDLHECLGHGSGQILASVSKDALKEYGSTIEEARADLFALYYIADEKLLELGLLDNEDAYKAEYYSYILVGAITQFVRIEFGKDIEESHMRNRACISRWILEKSDSSILEIKKENGKTVLYIYDYKKLRILFGQLLIEIQRIRSEGDFDAAKTLIERYGVKIDPLLHAEVLERYKKLNIAPYKGFVNPRYEIVYDVQKKPINVSIDYSEGYAEQMLRYSKEFSHL